MKRILVLLMCVIIAVAMAPQAEGAFLAYADEETTSTLSVEEPSEKEAATDTFAGTSEEVEEPATEEPDPEPDPTRPPHKHKYVSKVTKKATCKRKGVRTYTCECGDYYTKPIPKAKHKYKKKVIKKAKCTKGGKVRYRCSVCGKKYYKKTTKLGHKYKKKVLRKATCTHTGKARYTCKRCGKKYTKVIKKRVHHPKVRKGKYFCRDCGVKITKLSKYQKTLLSRDFAVYWAKKIAANNNFHYGKSKWAHHNGCYFCGTNQYEKSLKIKDGATLKECEKTYCCNPFVTAAYCHGAGAEEVDCTVKSKRFGLANDSNKVVKNKSWKKVKKPSKVTRLMVGDILLTPTHAMLYAGGGKVVHAQHHDNGVRGDYWNESIVWDKISDRQWKRTSKIYRYMGTGKF